MRTPRPWSLPVEPVSRALLAASGVTGAMLETRLRSGELLRLRQGVYLAASVWPADASAQHLVRARAELVANPAGVLSHASAAVFWTLPFPGFGSWAEQPVTITVRPGEGRRPRRTGAVHRVAALPAEQVSSRDGYPVTTPARTAVDLAAGRPLPEMLVVLDAAARLLCESYLAIAPRRSDYANARLVGAARETLLQAAGGLRRELASAIAITDPARESPAESLSAGHFELAGLPRPLFQAAVVTPMGTLFPDCLWPEHRLVGECDGKVKYAQADAYVQEKRREQVLRDLGFGVVRWLGGEIMSRPDVVVARVARALG